MGRLLDALAPYAAGLPYDLDEASLIRVRGATLKRRSSYPALMSPGRARTRRLLRCLDAGEARNDFAAMPPFLEKGRRFQSRVRRLFCALSACRRPSDRCCRRRHDDSFVLPLFAELQERIRADRARHLRSAFPATAACAVRSASPRRWTSAFRRSSKWATTLIAAGWTRPIIRSARSFLRRRPDHYSCRRETTSGMLSSLRCMNP